MTTLYIITMTPQQHRSLDGVDYFERLADITGHPPEWLKAKLVDTSGRFGALLRESKIQLGKSRALFSAQKAGRNGIVYIWAKQDDSGVFTEEEGGQ